MVNYQTIQIFWFLYQFPGNQWMKCTLLHPCVYALTVLLWVCNWNFVLKLFWWKWWPPKRHLWQRRYMESGPACFPVAGHDDVMKWKHFPRYWSFVRGIHRSPVKSPHKGQRRRVLMLSLICALNKRLNRQSWIWWFETPSRPLWRHCNVFPDHGSNIQWCPQSVSLHCNVCADALTDIGYSHYDLCPVDSCVNLLSVLDSRNGVMSMRTSPHLRALLINNNPCGQQFS